MQDYTEHILELIRRTSTDLPPDVERTLVQAMENEQPGSAAHNAMEAISKNIMMSREKSTPICQDTGTPIFYVYYLDGMSARKLRQQIRDAVAEATRRSYLRPNAVHAVTGKNTGNNLGDEYFPTIHLQEVEGDTLRIDLMLKGGGCENVGAQYTLPDSRLGVGRDLEGVRKSVLDAVYQAQGQGCAPGILGVAIGGDRGSSYYASKETLFRKLDEKDVNPDPELAVLEERLTREANQLGVGPMGFGGETTVLDTKITSLHRLPASFYVSVSYMCWAYRRRSMTIKGDKVGYS